MSNKWLNAHEFEKLWWGNCVNTYLEETKQFEYAERMGLERLAGNSYFYNLHGKSVVDIGGGATSLLLKCINGSNLTVIDPLPIPQWCKDRYEIAGITFRQDMAETQVIPFPVYDEVWIYNVLQHTEDPRQIIENAKKWGKLIRIFEWINAKPHPGHPQMLERAKLNDWLGGYGKIEDMSDNLLMGYNTAYFGVFPTPLYDKS